MQTGDVVQQDCIMMPNTGSGFGDPLVFAAGTRLPSYGLNNSGKVIWTNLPHRAGITNGAHYTVTAEGTKPCPQSGAWTVLGTPLHANLKQGMAFPQAKYIWVMC